MSQRDMNMDDLYRRSDAGYNKQDAPSVNNAQKLRQSAEIADQVAAFLAAGGKIQAEEVQQRSAAELSHVAVRSHLKLNEKQYRNYVQRRADGTNANGNNQFKPGGKHYKGEK